MIFENLFVLIISVSNWAIYGDKISLLLSVPASIVVIPAFLLYLAGIYLDITKKKRWLSLLFKILAFAIVPLIWQIIVFFK
jgi:hypothetical protein